MKRSMLVLGIACVGCQPTAINDPVQVDAPRPREALGIDFAGWPSVTEKPWPVAPVMLLMCAPPTPEMVRQREAEKKERGPHSESAVVVRVNPTGREQFISGQPVPVGTVVVKEKYSRYSPNAKPVAVAAMTKREPGYDPEHGDWEYAYEQRWPEQEAKTVRGKLDACIDCHQGARDKDHLFRPYLGAAR
jgi:hypothetical protein